MIKNDSQLRRTGLRIQELKDEVQEFIKRYSGFELEFWAGPLMDELAKLQAEIEDYRELHRLTFQEAVEGPLQHPFLLENISELLTKLRIAAKLTQEEMADKLGWQQSNLSRFEHENYSSQTIAKISEYVGALNVRLYVTPFLTEDFPRTKEATTERDNGRSESTLSIRTTDADTRLSPSRMIDEVPVSTSTSYSTIYRPSETVRA